MADQDLDGDAPHRMAQTRATQPPRVPGGGGLTGAARLPRGVQSAGAASSAPSAAPAPRRRRAARRRARAQPASSRPKARCSCTTGPSTSTRTTSRSSRRATASTTFTYDIYDNNEDAASPSSRAARPGYRHRLPDRRIRPGHGREGLHRRSSTFRPASRTRSYINATFKNLWSERPDPNQRLPRAQGLRHDRHPLPQVARHRGRHRPGSSSSR